MYRKRMGAISIIETTIVILVAAILSVSTLHLKDVLYASKAQSLIDYIEKQDSMYREIRDMGYGPFDGADNISNLRYDDSCQEVAHDDPKTAVVLFRTGRMPTNGNWLLYYVWDNYPINCLYVILGLLPREIGVKIEKSLDARTLFEALQDASTLQGIRKRDIWIGKNEFSPNGVKGFEIYGNILRSNMTSGDRAGDVLDAYLLDLKLSSNRQVILIVSQLVANTEISRSCDGPCEARSDISGKLIHFVETKGKDSIVSRRYAHCSYNDNGCAIPKSAFTGLTHNTGIGPIENMTGSSCGNRKSTKNECILVTRRMQEFAPWEDWNTIDNR